MQLFCNTIIDNYTDTEKILQDKIQSYFKSMEDLVVVSSYESGSILRP